MLLMAFAIVTITPPSVRVVEASPDPDWLNGWDYRKEIEIDCAKVENENLDNFPVLIEITLDNAKVLDNGDDIRFTENDGTTLLDYEIEYFDTENLIAHVRFPVLYDNENVKGFIYYGNSEAQNQENAEGVWDDNFLGVWHLEEEPIGVSLTDEPTNPTREPDDAWEGDGLCEQSDFRVGENEYISWYRGAGGGVYNVGFENSEDGISWTAYENNPLTLPGIDENDAMYPYVVQDGDNFYMFVVDVGESDENAYLYNVTDYTNPQIMNEGNPVLTISQAWEQGLIYNMGVAIVDNGTDNVWHMLYEAGSYPFELGYTYSTLGEMDWTSHKSPSNPVMNDAANSYLKYVPDKNALMSINSDHNGSYWDLGTSYAYLSDNLNLPESWHVGVTLVSTSGIHECDGHMIENFSDNWNIMISWNHNQTNFYQTYCDASLNEFFEWISGTAENDILDSTSGNNDGTSGGMDSDDQVAGKIDGSIDFDGTDDYIHCADSSDWAFGTNSFTIEFWVKPNNEDNNCRFIGQHEDSNNKWGFQRDDANDALAFAIKDGGSWTLDWYSCSWTPTAGIWYHIVLTRGNNTWTIYENGSYKCSTTDAAGVPDLTATLELGRFWETNYHDGQLDEFRISNVARNANWILTCYNNQNSPESFYSVGSEEEAPAAEEWNLIETWTGTVEAPAAWQLIESWTGTVQAPAAWQIVETWSGTVEAPAASDQTINPSADVHVHELNPTTNYGSNTLLRVGWMGSGQALRAFLKFDLSVIPAGSMINNAMLYLYNASSADVTVGIYGSDNVDWQENVVTWNDQPSMDNYQDNEDIGAAGIWHSWSITDWVSAKWDAEQTTVSVGLKSMFEGEYTGDEAMFGSREYPESGYRAYLYVAYTPPPPEWNLIETWTGTVSAPAANNAPNKPTSPSPTNGASGVSTSPTLQVTVTDPDGDSMTVYFYDNSDDSLIGTDTEVENGTQASTVWNGLNYETTYYWYAKASDGSLENTSDVWHFTTEDAPPPPPPEWQLVETWAGSVYATSPYAVNVTITPGSQDSTEGENLSYDVTVTNNGSMTDNYDLTAEDTKLWTLTLGDELFTNVGPGENRQTTLHITLDSTGTDAITVTAISQGDNSTYDSVSCTALSIPGLPDDEDSALPGLMEGGWFDAIVSVYTQILGPIFHILVFLLGPTLVGIKSQRFAPVAMIILVSGIAFSMFFEAPVMFIFAAAAIFGFAGVLYSVVHK